MLAKRIIPCLDIKNGRTVKGVHFVNLKDAGDPVKLATKYTESGADELVFLDISATEEGRRTLTNLVRRVASAIDIPFTVGGGISNEKDVENLLKNGADKVSINSAAVRQPILINQLSKAYGSQCIVVAIDARQINSEWKVHLVGGKQETSINLLEWAEEVEQRGAGEILFTSMDHDGTKNGFAYETIQKILDKVNIPVIASGGAGHYNDFLKLFTQTDVDAALAASVFHYQDMDILNIKRKLHTENICVRI